MNGQEQIKNDQAVLTIEYLPSINYSTINCGADTCYTFVLDNTSERDWHQVIIRIKGDYLRESTQRLECVRSGQSVRVTAITIVPDIGQLVQISESLATTFTVVIDEAQGEVLKHDFPITLLAYDQWAGTGMTPEHLAAFVVPNCQLLSRVKVAAAQFLEKWTGASQLDEYQTQDRNRVRAQVAAIYEALRSEGIVYSAPPASFEESGQRIRMADKVLTEKVGTCLDTSLLVASCLEACNIYPVVVVMKSHAMVGAWLTPTVSPQMVGDDVSLLLKEAADGVNNLVLLESTAITASESVPFEEAVRSALQKLKDERAFDYYVDIHRCRLGNIRPMPQRIQKDGTWTFDNEGVEHSHATDYVNELSHYDLRLEDTGRATTKQMIWERKLLDFSLRNNLLNTRLGRRVVPFISFGIEHLEDHLQNSEDYFIIPSPGKKIEPNGDGMYDSEHQAADYKAFVAEMIGDNKITSYLSEPELQNALTYVYRAARTSLEENGANSLFLALGMLRWFETAKSEQPRYAPILLMPVDIVRRSGSKYIIRKRDEDIMLNITLVELLKQNFSINLDTLKTLPKDDCGVDVKKIFTYFRAAIMEQKKWNVIEESMLGLFSFNKFVMWNDIHSNADKLAENTIVASLIENRDKQQADDERIDARTIDKYSSPMDFAIPLDVDSSQMEAIVESGRGRTFILHGPPGTGKSQTITNMIANALYQGRRVLFVAEKMAALSVVQARLEKIGLAPFCLELHSNKATKKHFLEQMDQVLNVTKIKEPADYATTAAELFAERKSLISYMDALHKRGDNGLSLYDCISEYLAIDGPQMQDGLPPRELLTASYMDNCKQQIEQIDTILSIVGIPASNALYGLEPRDNRLETTEGIKGLLQQIRQTQAAYQQALGDMSYKTTMQLQTAADMKWLEMFVFHLSQQQQNEQMQQQLIAYSPDLLRMDVAACQREWADINEKWFLPRYFAKKRFVSSMQRYGQIFESSIDDVLNRVAVYQQQCYQLSQQQQQLAVYAQNNGFNHQQRADACLRSVGREAFMQDANSILTAYQQLQQQMGLLATMTRQQNQLSDVLASVDRWLDGYQQMKDWYLWTEKKRELCQQNLQDVVSRIEQGERPHDVIMSFLKGAYQKLIATTIDADEQLRTFNGTVFRQQIEQYRRNTRRFQELSKEELYSKLAARVPSSSAATADGSEISILKRNIANGGRGNSIRSIIDNIPTLLPRLCPCMLMSPISVAQYIDLKTEKFDLVIFDEASQMPTSEAVGAIARGKALIVVGDSKQMPPTSFFSTTQVDEEEADIDDMESILDDCKTLSLREYYLSWHYRSKHESLIAFSNSQYYDNRLLTFPSVDDQQAKVTLVPVAGVYDKGRTRSNPEESKAIVREIIRRLSDPELSKHSIGVVSFSKVQGDRIEDDLTEELDRHPDLKDIAYNSEEPIFVKNLENVQGDERDVILFSVGYGPDKNGKVSMNFGPLNNVGGERRLNVAVSRARYEMIVFSTLKASQIDLRRSNAKGVEGLKGFLEFAETGRLPMVDSTSHDFTQSVMVSQICDMLSQQGYIARTGVGRSNFKVDIAVATQDHPEQYILGILCDGKTYYETKTTRDREIVQPTVMKMLGWNVMRVYSVDWYENRERSTQQLLDELKAREKGKQQEETSNESRLLKAFSADNIKKADIIQEPARNQGQTPYLEADVAIQAIDKADYNPTASYNLKVIRQILAKEQPITEGYLCKRVARIFGFGHAGANIQRAVSLAAASLYRDPVSLDGINSLWLDEKSSRDYHTYRAPSPRAITEIPVCEVMNAVHEVIVEEFSLPMEKIATLAARKLGFSNAGTKIVETINGTLSIMLQNGSIRESNGMVALCDA
ncbi:MAG: DUF4011 domain-containing protein [Prevotella sp.]|nr:DUF4011 domain-containing protein [Prevotella sp.]